MNVLCAGIHRSGSTWIYNVVRYLYLNQNYNIYCSFANESYDPENPAEVHVIKIHRYAMKWDEIADCIITSRRDLRDIAASAVRRGLVENSPGPVVDYLRGVAYREFNSWNERAALMIPYEKMILDKPKYIKKIAKVLNLKCNPQTVHQQVESLKPGKESDPLTMLHPNHFTDGGVGTFNKTLSSKTVNAINEKYKPWLISNGYLVR